MLFTQLILEARPVKQRLNKPGIAYSLAVTTTHGFAIPVSFIPDDGMADVQVLAGSDDTSLNDMIRLARYWIEHQFGYSVTGLLELGDYGVNKAGSSGGVVYVMAMLSAMTGIAIDEYAFTGEIDVHGNVNPVGAVTAKVNAAYAAGMKKVFIPEANLKDVRVQDYPIEIQPVASLAELANLLFGSALLAKGH